jgi:hypothetical protein
MKEYTLGPKRFMQTYNYHDSCTVSFYNDSRIDLAIVEFFRPWVVEYSCATFYIGVPYSKVDEYLETVGN